MKRVTANEEVGNGKPTREMALGTQPAQASEAPRERRPDFAARLKRIYGDRIFTTDAVMDDRDSKSY